MTQNHTHCRLFYSYAEKNDFAFVQDVSYILWMHSSFSQSFRSQISSFVKILRVLQILLFVLLISTCSKSKKHSFNPRFTVLLAQAPEALDPRFVSSAIGMRLSQLIFAPLFEIGDDLKVKPYLAESIEQIDPRTYEVRLKEHLVFHQGQKLTVDDVIYTFMQLGSEDVRSIHSGKFKNLSRVEKISERVLRFHLDKDWSSFPLELAGLGIVSKSCLGHTKYCREHWNGAGAYKVEEWNSAEEKLRLSAHQHFFQGAPKIKKINFRVVRNQSIRLIEMIDRNAALMIGDISPEAIPLMQDQKHLKIKAKEGLGYSYLGLNLRGTSVDDRQGDEQKRTLAALANVKVRHALSKAINIDKIISSKWRNKATRASSMLPKGHWAKKHDIATIGYDLKAAKDLLDAAGFKFRKKEGNRFHLTINSTPVRLRRSIALLIKEDLQAVGIKVDVRVSEWSTLYQEIKRGNFEMFSAKWTPVIEPDLMHWVFHSSNIPAKDHAGGNRGAYRNLEVDRLLELGRATSAAEKRAEIYKKVEVLLDQDLPYIPLWFEQVVAVEDIALRNFKLTRTASFLNLAQAEYTPQ